jgi:hypothetical protein
LRALPKHSSALPQEVISIGDVLKYLGVEEAVEGILIKREGIAFK